MQLSFKNGTLTTTVTGNYADHNSLANISIAGAKTQPKYVAGTVGGHQCNTSQAGISYQDDGVIRITNLESATPEGAWAANLTLNLIPEGGQAHGWHW